MSTYPKHLVAAVICVATAQYAGVANADVSWTFDTANCQSTVGPAGNCGSGNSNFADGRTYQGSGPGAVDVTVTGWGNTSNGDTKLELGQITHYGGGLGVRNADYPGGNGGDAGEGSSPEHAVDNDQRLDLVLFDFGIGNSVALNDIQIGWVSGDADIDLLAFTGGGLNDPTLSGKLLTTSSEDLIANGWSYVGGYDLSPTDGAVNLDPDGAGPQQPFSSRYWVIAAHTNAFGTSCANDSNGCPHFNDKFKIQSVAGKLIGPPGGGPGIPVPAPVALLGLGLMGLTYGHKRKGK